MPATIDLDIVRQKFKDIRSEMASSHIGEAMQDVIQGGLVSLVSKTHMLLYGPPGMNKSRVIHDLVNRVEGAKVFDLPGSRYATKEDLVGPLDMKAIDEGKYMRNTLGRIPEAHFAFLDEVLECGDALVKELHPILNERKYCVLGTFQKVPLLSAFGATNVTPDDAFEGKGAFLDRWMLRYNILANKSPEVLINIRRSKQNKVKSSVTSTKIKLEELRAAQQAAEDVEVPEGINETVAKIFKKLLAKSIIVSTRRLTEMDSVLKSCAWLDGRTYVDGADMDLLRHILWNRIEDYDEVVKIVAAEAKTTASLAAEFLTAVRNDVEAWKKAGGPADGRQKLQSRTTAKLLKLSEESNRLKESGRDSTHLDKAYDEIQKIMGSVREQRGT